MADSQTSSELGRENKEAPTQPDGLVPVGDVEAGKIQLELHKNLHGRHMQMIAIGGSIGAGLFVASGGALQSGGPASLLIGYVIIGIMILCTVEALGELAVLYPVEGAFFDYGVRFIDPSWGFAMGWQYSLSWLVVFPFEITAAGQTIDYWHHYNIGIWIAVFFSVLFLIQIFGVRGYGEVEFVLAVIKIVAVVGFIIFGIIVNAGGVPGDDRGYIGFRYWDASNGDGNRAFRNSFKGFCSVFVVAAFSFAGTELVGLAAAEAEDPRKSLPKATRQVFWRICGFYIVSLLIVGIIVPNNSDDLRGSSGANTKASPFVLAIEYAGVDGLPSVFNAVITIAVISVANSSIYGSTRTMQALALRGMAPKFLAYVDRKGRPLWSVAVALAFGMLAFINEADDGGEVFTWLLALSSLSNFFVWGSICLSHMRFRLAWRAAGRSLDDLPFRSDVGFWGSALGLFIVIICLMATFYVDLFPIGADPDAKTFFEGYLAAPIAIAFWAFWKLYSRQWRILTPLREIDLDTGRREYVGGTPEPPTNAFRRVLRIVF